MKEDFIFKSKKKPILLDTIRKYREDGGTFSEIAKLMNLKEQYTLNGKAWTENYMFRFFTENQ